MNRIFESRLTTGLQLFGILALLISIVVLFSAADRLRHNRNQMLLTSEVTQLLLELRQQPSVRSVTGYSDAMARLIGYGDVQISELSSSSGDGVFSREASEIKSAKTGLVRAWKSTKKAFSSAVAPTADTQRDGRSPGESLQQQFAQLRSSFDGVFSAISRDTLSSELLTANSRVLAALQSLDFLLNNRDSIKAGEHSRLIQSGLLVLDADLKRLVANTAASGGGSLIGYGTRNLLDDFVRLAEQFQQQAVTPAAVDLQRGNTATDYRQQQLAVAVEQADVYQRLLEFASHQNRRAILFAIATLCIALICLVLSLWRNWKSQSVNRIANSSVGDLSSAELDQLRSEITAIADGNLTVRASQPEAPALNAIAQATNHTVEMLAGLVRLFRRAADRLNELAASQQLLAQRWIKSEIKRHELFDMLSQNLHLQSQAIDQLHELETAQSLSSRTGRRDNIRDQSDTGTDEHTRDIAQQLISKIDACRDLLCDVGATEAAEEKLLKNPAVGSGLSGDGLLKMRQRMHELSGSISAVRLSAEQARLQVLNTSLQMTAYAGTAEIDDQSKLVADIQNVSNQLASTAAGAERMSSALADDLQQYEEACASNRHQLAGHLNELRQSVSVTLNSTHSACNQLRSEQGDTGDGDGQDALFEANRAELVTAALEHVQQQQAVLQQLLNELKAEATSVSDGDAIKLLEQISDIQKVSASLARSAGQYGNLGFDSAGD